MTKCVIYARVSTVEQRDEERPRPGGERGLWAAGKGGRSVRRRGRGGGEREEDRKERIRERNGAGLREMLDAPRSRRSGDRMVMEWC